MYEVLELIYLIYLVENIQRVVAFLRREARDSYSISLTIEVTLERL